MSFLNSIYLYGLLALAIPILLHIWHRRKPQPLPWGAMELLKATIQERKRRFQFEQWLIVLIRMLILALLAFLLARPLMPKLEFFSDWTSGRKQVIVVFDTTYSMNHDGKFDRAVKATEDILKDLNEEDAFVLILPEVPPRVFYQGQGKLLNQEWKTKFKDSIQQARPIRGHLDLSNAFQSADPFIRKGNDYQNELVLLMDAQVKNFSSSTKAELNKYIQAWKTLNREPKVLWCHLEGGEKSDSIGNLSIESLEVKEKPLLLGKSATVVVKLSNHDFKGEKVDLEFFHNGLEVDTQTVVLNQETKLVEFEIMVDKEGLHRLEARLPDDSLNSDNRYFSVIQVQREIPVLVVSNRGVQSGLQDSSTYLQIALAPGRERGPRRLKVEVSSLEDLPKLNLKPFACIFFVDVPFLLPGLDRKLESYVSEGGGFVILSGPTIKVANYNRSLFKDGQGLIPFEILSTEGISESEGKIQEVEIQDPEHPLFTALSLSPQELNLLQIKRWLKIKREAPSENSRPSKGLMRFQSTEPLLIEKEFGKGKVLWFLSSLDPNWSNLPLRTFFAPLCHEIVSYLSQGEVGDTWNLRDGDPFQISLKPEEIQVAQDNNENVAVTLRAPDGEQFQSELLFSQEAYSYKFLKTDASGFYSLLLLQRQPIEFAVNANRLESDLRYFAEDEIQQLSDEIQFDRFETVEDLVQYRSSHDSGRQMWPALSYMVVFFLFVELYWVQRSSRSRLKGAKV